MQYNNYTLHPQILFRASTGDDVTGDVAIDDVSVTRGQCRPQPDERMYQQATTRARTHPDVFEWIGVELYKTVVLCLTGYNMIAIHCLCNWA